MNSCLYAGTVRHRRSRPAVHDFRYRVFHLYLDLDELADVARTVRLFSVNRFNVVSFHDRDHMDRQAGDTKAKVLAFLRERGIELAGGKVFLLTSCRVLGYVFNPISLYYCHAESGSLAAVIAEVHNTLGGQHLYLLTAPAGARGETDGLRRATAAKAMYVSPFISMEATYDFFLPPVGERLTVGIVEREAGAHVLDAQLWARRRPLRTEVLARMLVAYPLVTLKTIAAIHLEALRLWLKGIPIGGRGRTPARGGHQSSSTTVS